MAQTQKSTHTFLIPFTNMPAKNKPDSTLFHQLGADWKNLHPNIQQRFCHDPQAGCYIFYCGTMEEIQCSKMGKLFARLTRLIGNPLTPYEGKNVTMDVVLQKRPNKKGVYWRRTYYYPDRQPYTVTSIKRENHTGQLQECVGGGFGMRLKVYAENQDLHFKSKRYFWAIGKFSIPLPHWLSPGETHVVHHDEGKGNFRFTITMLHPWLGQTFYQTGIFKEV